MVVCPFAGRGASGPSPGVVEPGRPNLRRFSKTSESLVFVRDKGSREKSIVVESAPIGDTPSREGRGREEEEALFESEVERGVDDLLPIPWRRALNLRFVAFILIVVVPPQSDALGFGTCFKQVREEMTGYLSTWPIFSCLYALDCPLYLPPKDSGCLFFEWRMGDCCGRLQKENSNQKIDGCTSTKTLSGHLPMPAAAAHLN